MNFHVSCALLFLGLMLPVQGGEDHHSKISEGEVHRFEWQDVEVKDFESEGFVLAVGGGGEGVIGQLKGRQVIAIDISKRELEEAPPGPLKLVMDARDLKFLDGSFDTATSFFTLMYISGEDHEAVFREIHRVLAPGGRFLIWDAIFGSRPGDRIKYGVVQLRVKLPDRKFSTGYGAPWPDEPHDLGYYKRQAEAVGFVVSVSEVTGKLFYLELEKPES